MTDFSVSPEALRQGGSQTSEAAATLRGGGNSAPAPGQEAFGMLLSNATAFTYPAATDAIGDFIDALADAGDGMGDALKASATAYDRVEDEAERLVRTIWGQS